VASPVLVPHFDLPFRFIGSGNAVVVDQDTLEDVSNCVEAIMRTVIGQRQELPEFGIPDPTLQTQPIYRPDILTQVLEWEPRAVVVFDQHPDVFDSLIADVTVSVSTKGVV
jgi:phage baseplate assembly protein W